MAQTVGWISFYKEGEEEKKKHFDCQQNSKSANWLGENRTGRGCFHEQLASKSLGTLKVRSAVQHLPPLSSDLREEGGSHTVLFSYKGSKGPSCPRRTDSVGRPSATEEHGQRGRIMGCQTGDWLIAGSMRHGLNPHMCK